MFSHFRKIFHGNCIKNFYYSKTNNYTTKTSRSKNDQNEMISIENNLKTQHTLHISNIQNYFSFFFSHWFTFYMSTNLWIWLDFWMELFLCRRVCGWIELMTLNRNQLTPIFIYSNIFSFFFEILGAFFHISLPIRVLTFKINIHAIYNKRNFSWSCYCSSQYMPQCKLREYCKWLWHDEPTKRTSHKCHMGAVPSNRSKSTFDCQQCGDFNHNKRHLSTLCGFTHSD